MAPPGKGPVIAQICPETGRFGAPFGQKRHGRVVYCPAMMPGGSMQSPGCKDMGVDQIMDRLQRDRAGSDLIG